MLHSVGSFSICLSKYSSSTPSTDLTLSRVYSIYYPKFGTTHSRVTKEKSAHLKLNYDECTRSVIKTVLYFVPATAVVKDVQGDKVIHICRYLNVNDRNSRIPLTFHTLRGTKQDTLPLWCPRQIRSTDNRSKKNQHPISGSRNLESTWTVCILEEPNVSCNKNKLPQIERRVPTLGDAFLVDPFWLFIFWNIICGSTDFKSLVKILRFSWKSSIDSVLSQEPHT